MVTITRRGSLPPPPPLSCYPAKTPPTPQPQPTQQPPADVVAEKGSEKGGGPLYYSAVSGPADAPRAHQVLRLFDGELYVEI